MPSSVHGVGVAHSVSTSGIIAQAVKGSHVLKIDGYSRIKGVGVGNDKCVKSGPFDIGGHPWVIRDYPFGSETMKPSGWIGFYLYHDRNHCTAVEASWEFSLLNHVGVPSHCSGEDMVCTFSAGVTWGCPKFIKRKALEESDYLIDDCFRVRCDVTVWTAVRTGSIQIDDIEPRVFRAMLHFVYTDSLPDMDSGGYTAAVAQHLLVAADKYGMERLKLICEDRLCDYINTGTAAATLELAEQYGFRGLKQACFGFLKTPGNLKAVMGTIEFQRLTTRFPSLLSELLANVAP